jgi:hypothetical protein
MFGRVSALVSCCASLILALPSTSMLGRSSGGKQSSLGGTNPAAQAERNVITVWKVGSPWNGDVPDTAVPPSLDLAARHLGYVVKIQSFPSRSFASAFFRAFEANNPPDVLAFENDYIRYVGAAPHGQVQGIASDPEINAALEQIASSLPSLQHPNGTRATADMELVGGPLTSLQDRGWEYLVRTSPNYPAARALATEPSACVADSDPSVLPTSIREMAVKAAGAFLENSPSLKEYSDSARIQTEARRPKERHVNSTRACGYWAVGDLAFVQTTASYTSQDGGGKLDALIVLRKQGSDWRALTASTDPVSTSSFVDELPFLASLVSHPSVSRTAPDTPILLGPGEGILTPAPGVRFADFSWHPSSSEGEVAEIVEFAGNGDACLFTIFFAGNKPETEHLSAGVLWSVGGPWLWRVWSISESGAVSFSSARSFKY